ncbi:hypothetical protein [Haloplasma contractile]|uniref:Uncharacterized protein n=1 Tax=Haloplasma contractile SSD-17B TaxID=1033810 RepID=U2FIR6_9MOLU|nr:hypothetical protein [Haloplasma contractile]ERJ11139.1 hypothetical protein HLPCO_002804 [Haloplasma contractile SSD-17B]
MEKEHLIVKRVINLKSANEYAKHMISRYTETPELYVNNFEYLVLGYEKHHTECYSQLSYIYVEKRGVRVRPSCDHNCASCDSSCMHFIFGKDSYFKSEEFIY